MAKDVSIVHKIHMFEYYCHTNTEWPRISQSQFDITHMSIAHPRQDQYYDIKISAYFDVHL